MVRLELIVVGPPLSFFFFFNDTATTEIYTLSLHDALPICMWAAAAPARAHLVYGIEDADSWATDAHKWLNVPYDSGLVFTRNADDLRTAMSVGGAYLAQDEYRVPYQYTPDFSRRARGVEVW